MLILKLFAWFALITSAAVHIGTLNGFVPLGHASLILHVGMFVVLIPTIVIHGRALKAQGMWRTFRGFPILSQVLVVALLAYTGTTMASSGHLPKNPTGADFVQMMKMFSSMWCYMYFLIACLISHPPRQ